MAETEERLGGRGPEQSRLSNGQWLVKTLKPAGCVLVLLLFILALAVCFTAGSDPIKGYSPPHDAAYYAGHPDELAVEISENVLPRLNGSASCTLSGGKVRVEIGREDFAATRSALLQYFDGELLELVERGA